MSGKHSWMALLYGVCTIVCIVLGASLVLSLILKFTSVQESSLTILIMVVSLLALFVGGLVSGGKNQQKGWIIGGITGLSFTALVFLIQFLGYQTTFTVAQSLYHLAYIVVAMIGGIIGVNLSSKRT